MPDPFLRKLEAHAPLPIEHRREIEASISHVDRPGPRENIVRWDKKVLFVNLL